MFCLTSNNACADRSTAQERNTTTPDPFLGARPASFLEAVYPSGVRVSADYPSGCKGRSVVSHRSPPVDDTLKEKRHGSEAHKLPKPPGYGWVGKQNTFWANHLVKMATGRLDQMGFPHRVPPPHPTLLKAASKMLFRICNYSQHL